MVTQITATLPTLDFPREVDYPTQEDWVAFSDAAELNFGILGNDWSTQMQLWKTEANAMSTEFNTNATIAQGLADYQGDWTSRGYTLGQTVSIGGIYYICKLTHATGQNPTDVGSLYWNLALGNWSLKVNTNMSGYTSKATPIDNDLIPLSDSASGFGIKKLSWANLKETIVSSFGAMINTLTAKTTVVANDLIVIADSAGSNASKKVTLANLKTFISSASSETVAGIIELATSAEAQAGTDDSRAITALKLFNSLKGSNQSLGGNGYQKLHGGTIIQWGRAITNIAPGGTLNITFPIAFPTDTFYANIAVVDTSINNAIFTPFVVANTPSNLSITNTDTDSSIKQIRWFAIGF